MKETYSNKDAHERMRPGAITAGGFLGPDKRPLADIIQHDEESFRRLGLVVETVARKL